MIGFFVECYGLLSLFADFFGVFVGYVQSPVLCGWRYANAHVAVPSFIGSVPVVGPYLEGPLARITGTGRVLPV